MTPFNRRIKTWLPIAFAFPCIGMLVLQIIAECSPFGNCSMLYSDMYHQYFPFFKAYREALLSGDSLLHNWSVGMGLDYLGLLSYYLASPLNLLSVLVPEAWLLPFFGLMLPVRLGLASLFFALFLKKIFGKDEPGIALFGCFYGLCAWALGYQWNIMWLDTFLLLPLVALGTIYLLRDKKFMLYTLTLFLSVFSNYYVGFFTCIFVFFLFFIYEICRFQSIGRFFLDLLRIALFSALAIGMTTILELPTLAALQTTYSSVNSFPEGFKLNIADENTWKGLLDAMRQVAGNMAGGNTPTFKEGLPNLYCGVGTIVLSFLFLTANKVRLRDKICSVLLLLFFMVSFIIRQLDYIWHGFHFTNMIPYRFSFLFSFVMLYIGYTAWQQRHKFQLWQLAFAGLMTLAIFTAAGKWSDPVFFVYNLVFLVLYLGLLGYCSLPIKAGKPVDMEDVRKAVLRRMERINLSSTLLCAVMAAELVLNIVNFGVNFSFTVVSNYPKGLEDTASIIRIMKERPVNPLFYRAEVTHTQTLNDGALNSYNGITTFTSSANVSVTRFMQALGFGARDNYNRYAYEESSPVANLFLNLKYMIERDGNVEDNNYFNDIFQSGKVHLLENNAYLPLGFLTRPELAELEFKSGTPAFSFQNSLFTAATGIKDKVWTTTPGKWLSIEPENVNITNHTSAGYCYYSTTQAGKLTYLYDIQSEGFLCLEMALSARNSYSVWKNNEQLFSENISLTQTVAVGQVQPGDKIEIRITCKAGETASANIRSALLNEQIFRQGYDLLNASTLKLTQFSNTHMTGTIRCDRDGYLYTSIPQNGNWFARVDGEDVETTLTGNAMVGIYLNEGDHEIEFYYKNAAFDLGRKITLLCAAVFAGIAFAVYYPKRKSKQAPAELPQESDLPQEPELPQESQKSQESGLPEDPEQPGTEAE